LPDVMALARISRVAVLLAVLGACEIVGSIVIALGAGDAVNFRSRYGTPPGVTETVLAFGVCVAMLGLGLATIVVSRRNATYRSRKAAIGLMVLGLVSCPPVGLLVVGYGLYVYTRADVRDVFRRGDSGADPWEIEHAG
jgi:hypothetical protein